MKISRSGRSDLDSFRYAIQTDARRLNITMRLYGRQMQPNTYRSLGAMHPDRLPSVKGYSEWVRSPQTTYSTSPREDHENIETTPSDLGPLTTMPIDNEIAGRLALVTGKPKRNTTILEGVIHRLHG